MNLSTTTQTTSSLLSLSIAVNGAETPNSGPSVNGDGFGDLLSQLSSIVPGAGAAQLADPALAADRQIAGLPTGKDLPVAASTPGLEQDFIEASDVRADARPDETPIAVGDVIAFPGLKTPLIDGSALMVQAPILADNDPADGVVNTRPATGLVLPVAQPVIGAASPTNVTPGAEPISAHPASAQPPQIPTATMASARAATPSGEIAEAAPRGVAVRIAAADAPTSAASTSSQAPASVASPVAAQAAAIAPAAAERPASVAREGAAATLAPAVQPVATPQAGRADTTAGQSHDQRGGEQTGEASPMAKPVQSASDAAKPIAAAIQNAADLIDSTVRAPVGTARTVASDPLANIERIVDQLSAARQFDLSKPAAIAVTHREFGALTVTFDQSANDVMNVRIAAEDNEAQKALSAAMAADRGAQRVQEGPVPTAQANAPNTQAGGERAAGNGQANAQAGSTDNGAGERRSGQSDNRERRDERATQHNANTPQSSADDALYA